MSFQFLFNKKTVFLTIVAMVILALLRELYFFPLPDMVPNPDVAWLVYAAQRLADGERLYVDVMETNPPLIVWMSLPAVWVGGWLGIKPILVFMVMITALSVVSLMVTMCVIREDSFLKTPIISGALALYTACMFFLMTPAIYGQREVLLIMLTFPYLLMSLSDIRNRPLSWLVVLMAAMGFAIKPFFMLLWGMNELVRMVEKRSIRSVFSWHNWVIGGFQLAYFTAVYFITPEYYSHIVPALMATYFTFVYPFNQVLPPILKVVIVSVFVLWGAKLEGGYKRVAIRATVWLAASVGFILLQRKAWLNHYYPMVFMAGFAIVIALLYLFGEWRKWKLEIGYRKFIDLCVAFTVMVGMLYLGSVFTYNMFVKPSKLSQKLIAEINEKTDGKYVYSFVNSLQPTFPAFSLTNAVFRGSFHHQWPHLGIVIREQQGDGSPQLLRVKKWYMDNIIDDLVRYPPELIIVDDNVNMEEVSTHSIHPENRDFIAVLSRDARFAEIWKNYEKYKDIESELYPDEKEYLAQEENPKKLERYSLYLRKK